MPGFRHPAREPVPGDGRETTLPALVVEYLIEAPGPNPIRLAHDWPHGPPKPNDQA